MPWEIDFLKSVFSKLQGSENSLLYDQIVEGGYWRSMYWA